MSTKLACILEESSRKLGPHDLVTFALCAVSSWFFSRYMNIEPAHLVWMVSLALMFVAARCVRTAPSAGRLANVVLGVFSALFTLSLILGEHLVIGDQYSGLADVNYVSAYGWVDVLAFACIAPGLFCVFSAPLACIRKRAALGLASIDELELLPLGAKWVLGLAVVIFVLWLPYLVIYWPGFVFNDSLSSLRQALGYTEWSNHFPVAYTAFIWACLKLANLIGFGNTAGVGLSTVIQMAYMAFGFGYLARWVTVRGKLRPAFGVVLAVAFGVCSYLGSFSVALWKDPIFSAAGLLLTLCLADLVWSRGKVVAQNKTWLALYISSGLVMSFLRSNGVFAVALVALAVAVVLLAARFGARRPVARGWFVTLVSSAAIVAIYVVVSGPVYTSLGVVPTESSEALGVPLNQMARVAALGGDMTDSDREYLNSIIPIEEYATRYRPCCTDELKWSDGFDNEALRDGMWGHWLSMLVRNPRTYFEAWELQTFGFWTVNTEEQVSGWDWNIGAGVPNNLDEDGIQALSDEFQIYVSELSLSTTATNLFPIDSWSVPIGWLFWGTCYLALLLLLGGRPLWVLGLIPSIGIALTLLIASPIWYWPRYGAVLQFCIPYYLLLAYLLFGHVGKD